MAARRAVNDAHAAGWQERMDLINKLHKEHRSGKESEDLSSIDDPDEVFRYRKRQAILNFQKPAPSEGSRAQVFKSLQLKSVGRILKPRRGKNQAGLVDSSPAGRGPAEGDAAGKQAKDGATRGKPPRKPFDRGAGSAPARAMEQQAPMEIVIPLANDRVKFSAIQTDRALHVEYAARYLEKLGVSPVPTNLQLIAKHIPLDQCKIQQVFHPGLSKHEKKNYIIIRPNQKHQRSNDSALETQNIPYETLSDDLTVRLDDEKDSKAKGATSPSADKRNAAADGEEEKKGTTLRRFDDYKESYVFPYNLRRRDVAPAGPAGPAADRWNAAGSTGKGKTTPATNFEATGATTVVDLPAGHDEDERQPADAVRPSRQAAAPAPAAEEGPRGVPAGKDLSKLLTEQRLRLQDELVNLVKRQAELSPDELNRLREMLEQQAAKGDLSVLQFHPDIDAGDSQLEGAAERQKPVKHVQTAATPAPVSMVATMTSSTRNASHSNLTLAKVNKELLHPPNTTHPQIRCLFQNFAEEFPFDMWQNRFGPGRGQAHTPGPASPAHAGAARRSKKRGSGGTAADGPTARDRTGDAEGGAARGKPERQPRPARRGGVWRGCRRRRRLRSTFLR